MGKSSKKWTQILSDMPVAPSIVIDPEDKGSVSTTMSRITDKDNKEYVLKQSRLTGEIVVVRIK